MLEYGISSSLLAIIGVLLFFLKLLKDKKKFKIVFSWRKKTSTKSVELKFSSKSNL